MFQKMASHIEFSGDYAQAEQKYLNQGQQPGPTPSLKDQIYSGAILKDMYHKPKPVPPTAENVHFFDNNQFNENVKERQKEIEEKVKEQQKIVNG